MLIAFLTPLLGGILLGCCFLPPPAQWLAWISLVPVAAAMTERRHLVASYVGMYCGGLAFNLITTDWIRTLEDGTGLSGRSAPDWLFQSQLLALFWPLTLWIGRQLVANRAVPMSLALPVVWVLHEFLLRNLWALVDQTGWQVYFLGYAIVDYRYLAQTADVGGVSALSFIPACVSGAIWDVLSWRWQRGPVRSRRSVAQSATFAALLVLLSCGYGAWAINRTQLVDGPIVWLMPDCDLREPPNELPWRSDMPNAPDVLLWSELAYHGPDAALPRPAPMTNEGELGSPISADTGSSAKRSEQALEQLSRQLGAPIVVGYTRVELAGAAHKRYNSAAFVDPRRGIQGSYDKIGLVPWTEFTPFGGLTARKAVQFTRGASYPVFELRGTRSRNCYAFASAICYDVAFPELFRRYMRSSKAVPSFFLVCSSERSDRTGSASRHVLTLAKVRAIECRRAVVRNVNFGHSGRIDSTGQLLDDSVALSVEHPTALGAIPIDRRSTLYATWGDWIPWGVLLIVLIAAVKQAVPARIFATHTAS